MIIETSLMTAGATAILIVLLLLLIGSLTRSKKMLAEFNKNAMARLVLAENEIVELRLDRERILREIAELRLDRERILREAQDQ